MNKRQVAPYELSQSGSHEYLQGYCAAAKSIRNFRADRIIAVLEIPDQVWPSNETAPSEEAISFELRVHAATRQVREVLPEITADSASATIQGFSASWISRTILSLGGEVEAVAPNEIRTAVHVRAKAALENYH